MKKSVAALLLGITAGCMLFPGKANAAVNLQKLDVTKKYSVDLDGDGVKENLKFVYKEGEEKSKLYVYVNGKKQFSTTGSYSWLGEMYLTDFNESDSLKDLYIQFSGNSDCLDFVKILQYKNQKLTVAASRKYNDDTLFTGRRSLSMKQQGDEKITFSADTPFFAEGLYCYYVNMNYEMKDGKLVKCAQNLYPATNSWKLMDYTLTSNITFTTKAGGKETAFQAKKNEVVHINAIYCKHKNGPIYVQMKNKDGKTGWYKVPKEKFFKEEYAWG